jgi:hypothetical protein
MVARPIPESIRLQVSEAGEHIDAVANLGQRLQNGSQLKSGSLCGGNPLFLDDAIGNVYKPQPQGASGFCR